MKPPTRPPCFVSNQISGPCCKCHRHVDHALHITHLRGIFCGECCPIHHPPPQPETLERIVERFHVAPGESQSQ